MASLFEEPQSQVGHRSGSVRQALLPPPRDRSSVPLCRHGLPVQAPLRPASDRGHVLRGHVGGESYGGGGTVGEGGVFGLVGSLFFVYVCVCVGSFFGIRGGRGSALYAFCCCLFGVGCSSCVGRERVGFSRLRAGRVNPTTATNHHRVTADATITNATAPTLALPP